MSETETIVCNAKTPGEEDASVSPHWTSSAKGSVCLLSHHDLRFGYDWQGRRVSRMATIIHNGANAGVYFPVYDGHGNVVGYVRAADGVRVAQYEYGPFGELIRVTGPLASSFHHLFSTKYLDWETGLYYYGHRYYHPTTGRWLSRDPIGEGADFSVKYMAGTQPSLNLYGFVGNNPNFKYDFLGLSERDVHNIVTNFLRGIMEMCNEGKRCDNKFKNNCLAYSPFHDNLACGDQADYMAARLNGPVFDSSWSFGTFGREDLTETFFVFPFNFTFSVARGPRGPHHWGEAQSDDPNDPIVKFDPWTGVLNLFYLDRVETYKIQCDPYMFTHTTTSRKLLNYPLLDPLIYETVTLRKNLIIE